MLSDELLTKKNRIELKATDNPDLPESTELSMPPPAVHSNGVNGDGQESNGQIEFKIRITERKCFKCGSTFNSQVSDKACPADGSMLYPVMSDPFLGSVLDGRYEVLEPIGTGGSSTVYKAIDRQTEGLVAIKRLQSHILASEEGLQRLEQEVSILCRLQHKNIVSVRDYGLVPQPFIVMDYAQGLSLATLLNDQRVLPAGTALAVFIQICEALNAAHKNGIVHRDLKPSNIVLKNASSDDCFVKILDFSVAKLLEGPLSELTRTREAVGSPLYMSPEQWSTGKVDARSDIYSFGCVMYECLTGNKPFEGDNLFVCMNKHFSEMPSRFATNKDDKQMKALEDVIFKAMDKKPENRYQNADELIADLQHVKAGTAQSLNKLSTRSKPKTAGTRNRKILPVLIASIMALIAISLINLKAPQIQTPPSMPSEDPIVAPERHELSDTDKTRAELGEQFRDIEAEINRLRNIGQNAQADDMERQLKYFKGLVSGPFDVPVSNQEQLCVIDIYNGLQEGTAPARADVTVTHKGNPIVLLLNSYEGPLNWHLKLKPGVRLKKVLLANYEPAKVWGLPKNIPVQKVPYISGDGESTGVRELWLLPGNDKSLSGLPIATVQGKNERSTFIVGPDDPYWRYQQIMKRMKSLYDRAMEYRHAQLKSSLKQARFTAAITQQPSAILPFGATVIADCTPFSIQARKLPTDSTHNPTHVVEDPKTHKLYGIDNHEFFQITPGKEPTVIRPSFEVPGMSWLSGITYDSKRERFLISSAAFIHCFWPATGKWGCLAKTEFLSGLAYSESDDCIYSIIDNHAGKRVLAKFDAQGKLLQKMNIKIPPLVSRMPDGIQMFVKGHYLILVDQLDRTSDSNRGPARCFVIDLLKGMLVSQYDLPLNDRQL